MKSHILNVQHSNLEGKRKRLVNLLDSGGKIREQERKGELLLVFLTLCSSVSYTFFAGWR